MRIYPKQEAEIVPGTIRTRRRFALVKRMTDGTLVILEHYIEVSRYDIWDDGYSNWDGWEVRERVAIDPPKFIPPPFEI